MKTPFFAIVLSAFALIGSAQSALISGPTQITATTTITAGGFGSIDQLVDGIGLTTDGNPFNGYGPDATSGTISLDLVGEFTLYDFVIANDINVMHEGVKDFTLSFYNSANELISTTGTYTAAAGLIAPQTFSLGEIHGVSRVDFNILNVQTETDVVRIEIREVAFNGIQEVPEPSALLLSGLGTLGFCFRRRRA